MLSSDWFSFPGPAQGSDWLAGGGVRSGDFQGLFSRNLTKRSSLDSSLDITKYPRGGKALGQYVSEV